MAMTRDRSWTSSERWLGTALVVVLVAAAAILRWDQDDAFISYRYAEHLLEGNGLVWNIGDPVEGYTNFLYVLALAATARAGVPIPEASHLLGLIGFSGSLLLLLLLAQRLFGSPRTSLLVLALVGSNYSFLSYATGGLETSWAAFFALLLVFLVVRGIQESRFDGASLLAISVASALACMTRPDAVIVCAVTGPVALWHVARERSPATSRGLRIAALIVPATALLSAWLVWKLHYYGDLLPNTSRVKLGNPGLMTYVRGVAYVGLFFTTYWMLPALLASAWRGWRGWDGPFRILAVFSALWLAYLVRVGGDIMEFRLLVPAIPFLVILLVRGVLAATARPGLRVALLALLPIGSLVHAFYFPRYVTPRGISNIPELRAGVDRNSPISWSTMGERLRQAFPGGDGPVIAVSPAGAIPFYSRLPAVDVLGLNDRWVARHGFVRRRCNPCAAHPRLATIAYLRASGVHLVLGHPQIVPLLDSERDVRGIVLAMFYGEEIDYENVPDSARLVVVPVDETRGFAALELAAHPSIEQAIERHGWPVSPWPARSSAPPGSGPARADGTARGVPAAGMRVHVVDLPARPVTNPRLLGTHQDSLGPSRGG